MEKIDKLIARYEAKNCEADRPVFADEINEVLSAIGAPEIAVDRAHGAEEGGTNLFSVGHLMALHLAKRLSALESIVLPPRLCRPDRMDVLKAEAKLFIDANVWDGADGDSAGFNPDELQELVNELIDHLYRR